MPFSFIPHHTGPDHPGDAPLLFAFRRRELLVTTGHALPGVATINREGIEAVRTQYLGRLGEVHCYSAELEAGVQPPEGLVFRDLRMLFGSLSEELHTLAGRAVQIVEWDRTHQYCGACGEKTVASENDRSRKCPDCQIPMYPRLSPAMIVAVEKDDQILLARSGHFPPGIYSTLAGFVEPGESVEAAVVREVWEETRIVVDDVRYFASQPWPFPNSLMLGFTARYVSGEIDTSHDAEVEEADWFAADQLPNTFPGHISISQWLLGDFIDRHRSA
ncbi:MAG: NAD(+) diphosphatase [Deltaproteobacteria bacterium]|nr:NAD(+) diphosphatase [Deltaproteobacteria bacterium]